MDLQTLAHTYREKTDEELLELAKQRLLLTSEARAALTAELASRRVVVEVETAAIDNVSLVSRCLEHGDSRRPLKTGDFIEEVLKFYAQHRWAFVKLISPAVLLTSIAYWFRQHELFELHRQLPHGIAMLQHRTELVEIGLVNWGTFLFSWSVFSLSFGAICVATEQIQAGHGYDFKESFEVTGQRLGKFLYLTFLLSAIFLISLGIFGIFLPLLSLTLLRHPAHSSLILLSYLGYGVAALLASRFGLSVPAFLLDDYDVGGSMARSMEITRGRWGILAALLFKSIAGGYIAAMLPFWLARFIPASVQLPTWFGWFLTAASVALVLAVEPLMFIGFALLYLKAPPVPHPVKAHAVPA